MKLILLSIVIFVYIFLLVALLRINLNNISTRYHFLLSTIEKLVKHRFLISLLLFIIAICLVFLLNLGVAPVQMWDESRRAVNALEMSMNGNFIVTYFDGNPDMWGTKPPLLIWLIVLSMKIFGYNEFALRLPSALCAMITSIIIFVFASKYLQDIKIALIGGLVLITSHGFIGYHTGRTGDYDALLVLWITIYSLSYFIYLHSDEPKKQNFYWSIATVAIILAVLTKGIAGLLPLPGIILYTAYQKKFGKLLFSSRFYISLLIFIGAIFGYYFLREYYNPGYISSVLNNEVGGRYLETKENNSHPFLYYIKNLINYRFIPWIYLLPVGLLASIFSQKKNLKNLGIFGCFYLTCYLLIVSSAKTKLPWYDNPFYPIAALVIGIGGSEIFSQLSNYFSLQGWKRQLIVALTIISIFSIPYFHTTYNLVYKQEFLGFEKYNNQLMYRDYFQEIFQAFPQLKKFTVVNKKYNGHVIFYSKLANLTKNYSIYVVKGQYDNKNNKLSPHQYLLRYGQPNKDHKFIPQEVVVTCEAETAKQIAQHYQLKLLHNNNNFCSTFVIE